MKNCRTPRTLAECEFTTDYPRVPRPGTKRATLSAVLLCVAAGIAFGVLVALGVPRG